MPWSHLPISFHPLLGRETPWVFMRLRETFSKETFTKSMSLCEQPHRILTPPPPPTSTTTPTRTMLPTHSLIRCTMNPNRVEPTRFGFHLQSLPRRRLMGSTHLQHCSAKHAMSQYDKKALTTYSNRRSSPSSKNLSTVV